MSDSLMTGFYSRLTSNDGAETPDYNDFYDAVGGRIFAIEADPSEALPLAIYQMESPVAERYFDGKVRSKTLFRLSIFGKAESGIQTVTDIAEKAFNHLDDAQVTVAGHDRGVIRGLTMGGPLIEGEYSRVDLTFEMVATSTS